MTQTGAVERRGARHRIFYEYACACGVRQWIRQDHLDRVSDECRHRADRVPAARPGYFVAMVGSAHAMVPWAAGEPNDFQPWAQSTRVAESEINGNKKIVWEPPPSARGFSSRQEATQWISMRRLWLASRGRPQGQYKIVNR